MARRFIRNVLSGHVAFFVVITSACFAADWPQFHGGQTLSGVASSLPGNILAPLWSVRLPTIVSGSITYSPGVTASVAIATVTIDGAQRKTAFVASQNTHVYAFDAGTGNQLWDVSVGDRVEATPLVKDNVVYVVTNSGILSALDAANGSTKWVHTSGGLQDRSSPNFSGTNIVCGASFPKTIIYAVPINSTNNAPEAWHVTTDQFVYSSPAVDPATQNIYCGSDDGKVYAVKPDGTALWAQPFATTGGVFRTSAAVGNGKIYITGGDYDWALHAVNAATGALVWDVPMRPDPDPTSLPSYYYLGARVSTAAVDGSFICIAGGYCSSLGTSQLYAYKDNGTSATPLWKATLPNKSQDYLSSPAVTPSSVIVGVAAVSDPAHPNYPTGRLYVLDRNTGAAVWYADGSGSFTGGAVLASPAISGNLVVIGDTAGYVSAYQGVQAGDVDGDGSVTVLDAEALMASSSFDGSATPFQLERGDLFPMDSVPADGLRSFGNGKITPADVDRILRYSIGLEPRLP